MWSYTGNSGESCVALRLYPCRPMSCSPCAGPGWRRRGGLGEQADLAEVADVYLPLSRLINLQVAARQRLYEATTTFLGEDSCGTKVPYIIGIAGSVAVGKSTTARILRTLLARWPDHPSVDLVPTNGLLYPGAQLMRRGI